MKDKNLAALLALFLGGFGAHKFYLGRPGWGLLYLFFSWTMIPALASFIEFLALALMDQQEFDRRYNTHALAGQPVVVNMLPPAGYGHPVGPHVPTPNPQPDIVAKIEKLNELRIAGLLTEDEFQQQKQKLLDAM